MMASLYAAATWEQAQKTDTDVNSGNLFDFTTPASLISVAEHKPSEAPIASTASANSGYLEVSSVDAAQEMAQMISSLKEFGFYQNATRLFEDASARVNSQMARV